MMKVPYKVSEEYRALFETRYVVAEVMGIVIIIGGLLAHTLFH